MYADEHERGIAFRTISLVDHKLVKFCLMLILLYYVLKSLNTYIGNLCILNVLIFANYHHCYAPTDMLQLEMNLS